MLRVTTMGLSVVFFLLLGQFCLVEAAFDEPRDFGMHEVPLVRAKSSKGDDMAQYLVRVHPVEGKTRLIWEKLAALSHGPVKYIPHDTFTVALLENQVQQVILAVGFFSCCLGGDVAVTHRCNLLGRSSGVLPN